MWFRKIHVKPQWNHVWAHIPVGFKDNYHHLSSETCQTDTVLEDFWKRFHRQSQILSIINFFLSSGSFPSSFKNALVCHLLKKTTLHYHALSNFRPLSNFFLFIKNCRRICVFSKKLKNCHWVFEKWPHTAQTALIQTSDDLLLAVDSGACAILITIF